MIIDTNILNAIILDTAISQSILTALLVGGVAAMTLTVSGLKNMYDLANNVRKSRIPAEIDVKNDRIYYVEHDVLENTYRLVLWFALVEGLALLYIISALFLNAWDWAPLFRFALLSCGLIAFFVGIFKTVFQYTDLKRKGLIKVVSEESSQTEALQPSEESSQTEALQPSEESSQTEALQPSEESSQTEALQPSEESSQTEVFPLGGEGAPLVPPPKHSSLAAEALLEGSTDDDAADQHHPQATECEADPNR